MVEITFDYWNKLADQVNLISSLLGGFSIAVIANILVSDLDTKLMKKIMVAATFAACFFLVTVFAMTKLMMMTTKGYPLPLTEGDTFLPRIIGVSSFLFGTISLLVVIGLAGWTKSKRMGRFTTTIAIITFIGIMLMTT